MTGLNFEKLDIPARADLLCFLVMAQVIGHADSGQWLRTDQAVEIGRIWAASHPVPCDWLERARLVQLSVAIAPTFQVFPCFRDPKELIKLLVDGWQLDYNPPTVRGMLDVCAERLPRTVYIILCLPGSSVAGHCSGEQSVSLVTQSRGRIQQSVQAGNFALARANPFEECHVLPRHGNNTFDRQQRLFDFMKLVS
jgi:hypothetical protein